MSNRPHGLLTLPGNFEVSYGEPLDARQRVKTKASLYIPATWTNPDGNIYLYKGIIVSVYDDTPDNNKTYKLIDDDFTLESSWEILGSGAGSNTLRGTGFPTPLTVLGNDNQFYIDDAYIDSKGRLINWSYHSDRNEWYPTNCCWSVKYIYDTLEIKDGVKLFVVGKKIEEVAAIEDVPHLQINKIIKDDIDLTQTITKGITKDINDDLEIIETILFIFFGNEINSRAINETGIN